MLIFYIYNPYKLTSSFASDLAYKDRSDGINVLSVSEQLPKFNAIMTFTAHNGNEAGEMKQ